MFVSSSPLPESSSGPLHLGPDRGAVLVLRGARPRLHGGTSESARRNAADHRRLGLLSKPFLWFYIYYAVVVGLFAAFWHRFAPHAWFNWSILGSALIIFVTYFQVQVSVAINDWYGPFYDLIQAALSKSRPVTLAEFYGELLSFAGIAFVAVTVAVLTRFFVSHNIFRWRTAMNNYYTDNWERLRHIEGASQRVQEDTMRFAGTVEGLGVSLIDAVMTLIAFLPVLLRLSANVTEIPIFGVVPYPLVVAAILWSIFGTAFLALIGIRLPGLEFRNQRVEAAFRKELVYGEDNANRAQPQTLGELFAPCESITSGFTSTICTSTSAAISICRPTTSSPSSCWRPPSWRVPSRLA